MPPGKDYNLGTHHLITDLQLLGRSKPCYSILTLLYVWIVSSDIYFMNLLFPNTVILRICKAVLMQ